MKKQNTKVSAVINSLMGLGRHAVSGDKKIVALSVLYKSALESGTPHEEIATALNKKRDSEARKKAIIALGKLRSALSNDERTDIINTANANVDETVTAETLGLPPKRDKDTQEGQGVIVSLCEMLIAYLYCLFAKGEGQGEYTFIRIASENDSELDDPVLFTAGNPVVLDGDNNEIELTLGAIFAKAIDSTSGTEDSLQTQIANTEFTLLDRLAVISKVTRGVADCLKGTNGKMRDEWAAMVTSLRAAQTEANKATKLAEKKQATREKAIAVVDEYLTVKGAFVAMFEHAGELLSQDGFDKLPRGTDKRRDALVNNEEVAADLAKGARSEILKAMKSVAK
jgi:hypothetical protein